MGNPLTQIDSKPEQVPNDPAKRNTLKYVGTAILSALAGNALGADRAAAANIADTNPDQFRVIDLTNVAQLEELFKTAIKRMDKITSMLGGGGEDRLVLFDYLKGCGCLVLPDLLGKPIKVDEGHNKYLIFGLYGESGNVEYTTGEGNWTLSEILPDIIQKVKDGTYTTSIPVLNDVRNQELLLKAVDKGAKAQISDLMRFDDTHAYFLAPWCRTPVIATVTSTAQATLTPTPTRTPAIPTSTTEIRTKTPKPQDTPSASDTPKPRPTNIPPATPTNEPTSNPTKAPRPTNIP